MHSPLVETPAVYIPRKTMERREWLAFLYPLQAQVWTLLFVNSFGLLIALKCLEWYYHGSKSWFGNPSILLVEALGDLWMLGASYFGRKPNQTPSSNERAIRIMLLLSFLSGNIVFMAYRASLTAELSVRRFTAPFQTVDELTDSDYWYNQILLLAMGTRFYLVYTKLTQPLAIAPFLRIPGIPSVLQRQGNIH